MIVDFLENNFKYIFINYIYFKDIFNSILKGLGCPMDFNRTIFKDFYVKFLMTK